MAARKARPIASLKLPEAQGEVICNICVNVGAQGDRSDQDYAQAWRDAEATIVAKATAAIEGLYGIAPTGYQLVRDDDAKVLRLNLVKAEPAPVE